MTLIYQLDADPFELDDLGSFAITDRTRIITGKGCPRKRWYAYHSGPANRGIELAASSEDLHLGTAVHLGLEQMLLSGEMGDAPEVARQHFLQAWQDGKILIQNDPLLPIMAPEAAETLIEEQGWLIYALLWTFGQRLLASLLNEYEVVSIEEEIDWALGRTSSDVQVIMTSRPDAVLRRKSDQALVGVSYKTRKSITDSTLEEILIDEQVATEMLAIEARYQEPCAGIIYLLFVKDEKRMDRDFGFKRYNSFLIRPWRQIEALGDPSPSQYNLTYEWVDNDGKTRRIGPKWKRSDIWTSMEMDQWLDWLNRDLISPQLQGISWLDTVIGAPRLVSWSRPLLRDWLTGARATEDVWNESLLTLAEVTPEPQPESIFSKRSNNCHTYGTPCQYYKMCWQDETPLDQLVSGRMKVRDPNHPFEYYMWEGQPK